MEDSQLENSLACRRTLRNLSGCSTKATCRCVSQVHPVLRLQLISTQSDWQNGEVCGMDQIPPSERPITDPPSASGSDRGNMLTGGDTAWPQRACSLSACGQPVQRATRVVTKGSLHHWLLPLHHRTSWPFHGEEHLGKIDRWNQGKGGKKKGQDRRIWDLKRKTWWGWRKKGPQKQPHVQLLFESH